MTNAFKGVLIIIAAFISLNIFGCGSSDGNNENMKVAVAKTGAGVYLLRGVKMDGISKISLNLSYPTSEMSSPSSVTKGDLVAGATMTANTQNFGYITVDITSSTPLSGAGDIVNITFFTEVSTTSGVRIDSVDLKGPNGEEISTKY